MYFAQSLAMHVVSDDLFFFFFNDTATTEIYTSSHTLSLHDALPISSRRASRHPRARGRPPRGWRSEEHTSELQSRELISYAVFCLKKKKKKTNTRLIWEMQVNNHMREQKSSF